MPGIGLTPWLVPVRDDAERGHLRRSLAEVTGPRRGAGRIDAESENWRILREIRSWQ